MNNKKLNADDFRICEYFDEFYIQRLVTTGCIFKSKEWIYVNKYGDSLFYESPKKYKSLKKARKALGKIIEGYKYHSLNDDKQNATNKVNKTTNIHSLNDEK